MRTLTEMRFNRKNYTDEQLFHIYKALLKPRLIEERMLILLRQGKISKWFSGMGQEAIAVGSTLALEPTDYILPLHRNLGVFTSRNLSLERLFAQFQGKKSGYTKGRDRSFHFGSKPHHIVGMISHLGPQLAVGCGIALAEKLNRTKGIALAYSGDGGTSEGDFHEALNVAAVWDLPIIFMIENNQYGLSTPIYEQYRCEHLVDKGIGYGMEAIQIDGNNVLEVYSTVLQYATEMRYNPRPILIEALTFRMRGHEEASGTKYIPQHLFDEWALRDPIANYEKYLLDNQIITPKMALDTQEFFRKEIQEAFERAYNEPDAEANTAEELADIYAPYTPKLIAPQWEKTNERRMIDAISEGLFQAMQKFPELILMGQDIAEYGGAFKITKGFVEQFGKDRVRNTPLCESAIIGAGLGLSIKGMKSVIEMQFADFVSVGFNQIVNNLAKIHWRWGQNADVVIRMPTGAGTAAGPFHSQSNEAWFFHTPGLKIVYPSNPFDAKGLLCAAIEDINPVMYFEHKFLYRSTLEPIPEAYYTLPIGKAAYVAKGEDLTIVTYGMGVHWAKEALAELQCERADLIDLRTLLPWDKETIAESVKKTGKVLVCHEDCLTGGIAAEIAAWIAEHLFQHLDAPIMREGALDTPVPFMPNLEQNFLPKKRIKEKIQALIAF